MQLRQGVSWKETAVTHYNSRAQWGSINGFTYLWTASPKMQERSHIPAHVTVSVVRQVQSACPCRALPSEIDSGCSQRLFFSFEPLSRRHQTQIKLFKRVSAAASVLVLACAHDLVLPSPARIKAYTQRWSYIQGWAYTQGGQI